MIKKSVFILALILLFASQGCSFLPFNNNVQERDIKYSTGDGYKKPLINVYIQPEYQDVRATTIGILNFNGFEKGDVGAALAKNACDYLKKYEYIKSVNLLTKYPLNIEEAVKAGKDNQNNFILYGHVDEFVHGGSTSDSRVAMTIKIIDVRTERTLWYVEGSMNGEHQEYTDYFFYSKESAPAPSGYRLCSIVLEEILFVITKSKPKYFKYS